MLTLGALSFIVPAALFAFLVLPLLWWLLRLIPPAPQRVRFPAIRFVMRLVNPEESSAKTPLWLVILRTALIVLVILAAAHPVLNAGARLDGEGPVVLVVDDGWGAARNWSARQALLTDLIDQAGRADRAIAMVTTAPAPAGTARDAKSLMSAGDAKELALALTPKPWPTDRVAASTVVKNMALSQPASVVWLSDGLDGPYAKEFAEELETLGLVTVFADPAPALPRLLLPPEGDRQGLKVRAVRANAGDSDDIRILGRDDEGRVIVRQPLRFDSGERHGEARIDLPVEFRNRLTKLEIEGEHSAGGVVLLDERWRRRPVGIVTGTARRADQPLLDEVYYLDRALDPFTEVRKGTVSALLSRELAMMAIPDSGRLNPQDISAITGWVEAGGILVRFAGPLLAAAPDSLLPVRLRAGDRELGGALSWSKPAGLAAFDEKSPFYGIAVPKDVKIRRQVLAQPSLDLVDKTWARLQDGTPLVTAERRGKGWVVLVHTTANPTWSDLPLSGLFVQMLEKLVEMGHGVAGVRDQRLLAPLRSVGGFGDLVDPLPGALAIPGGEFAKTKPGPRHPPGYYGEPASQVALNLSPSLPLPAPLPALGSGVSREDYGGSRETDTRPWLLTLALILAVVDLIASLALRGLLTGARASAGVILLLLIATGPAMAQSGTAISEKMMDAGLHLRMGYILTGDTQVDNISREGLNGLTTIANARTAAEMAKPMAVDPETDELSFFPLLYWPITTDVPKISDLAARHLNEYIKRGGTILFDTRDQGGTQIAGAQMREIGRHLDLPPLVPIPDDHVLGRSYYLLREYPGRYAGGGLWVERRGSRINDGVSSIIVGGNDWAAAWAADANDRPLYPVMPGGERQRELAYRFGINLLMYVLTGNYKEDQVHLPAILERLGQ